MQCLQRERRKMRFQSTLLQEERQEGKKRINRGLRFQSTLLQEERLVSITVFSCNFTISIHAPTRGATLHFPQRLISATISIHAPTRGATRQDPQAHVVYTNFNPRSYKRSDGERMKGELTPK